MAGCWPCATIPSTRRRRNAHGIAPIDLLVVNLYPFEATVAKGAPFDDCIENIDIGGPAMIRAAAKNHAGVTVVVDAEDYARVLDAMQQHGGATTLELRKALAAKAFARTAAYDAAIGGWFADALGEHAPTWRSMGGRLAQELRYGENPHQRAAFYKTGERRAGVATAVQHQGKELSYNNLNDTDAAFELVAEFDPKRFAGGRHHQACQSLRRGAGSDACGSLRQGAALRSGQRVRRHHRAERLYDRVEALGGHFELSSPAGEGTSLHVWIPFEAPVHA